TRDQVALTGALQLRRAAAFDAQELAVFSTGRDLQLYRALGRRHLDGRAQRRLRKRHRHVDLQVGLAAPPIKLRGLDPRDDVEVAGGAAAVAGLALAAELDACAVLDAGRNLHLEASRPPLAAGAAAVRARLLDDCPVPAAARAG